MKTITDEEYKEYLLLKRLRWLNDYAQKFWNRIGKELFIYRTKIRVVPIYFEYMDVFKAVGKTPGVIMQAETSAGERLKSINIVVTDIKTDDYIKTIIRHEELHLALELNDLKEDDYSAVFKILCDYYDADFYIKLTGLELDLFEKASHLITDRLWLIEKYKDSCINNILSGMVEIFGDKSVISKKGIDDVIIKLKEECYGIDCYMAEILLKKL